MTGGDGRRGTTRPGSSGAPGGSGLPGTPGGTTGHGRGGTPWLTTPPVCPTPGDPGRLDGTGTGAGTDGRRHGKGYPVGESNAPAEGYSQADDPTWKAGPGTDATCADGSRPAGDAAAAQAERVQAGRVMEDGVAVGRPPWLWLAFWTSLGLGVVALRRRRDRSNAPAEEA